jgi:FkbM family methyltransferase
MNSSLSIFNYQNTSIYYRPNTVDEAVLAHSFDNDIFYPSTPEYKVSKDAVVIDVGGHIGTFSIYSILSNKASKAIVLEPNKESFEILAKNIETNSLSNQIRSLQCALSDKSGIVKLYLDDENWGHSLTNTDLKKYEEVKAISLSSLFQVEEIKSCDLIKFNCEGAEFQIILSLDATTLSKVKMMIILFHEDLAKGASRKMLTTFLKKNGFMTRTDETHINRGWIIAKNKMYYSLLDHQLFQLSKWVRVNVAKTRSSIGYILTKIPLLKKIRRAK